MSSELRMQKPEARRQKYTFSAVRSAPSASSAVKSRRRSGLTLVELSKIVSERKRGAFTLVELSKIVSERKRSAFTLVELLVTITILAILASLILAAMAGASGMAREAKTKGIVTKLHALVMGKFETYTTRRVPVDPRAVAAYYFTLPSSDKRYIPPSTKDFDRIEVARLDALRELMRMEMPDAFTDIQDNPITQWGNSAATTMSRPAVSSAYKRALNAIASPNNQHVQAECLYLFISKGLDDPDVMEQFSASEIGDADGDGLPEFIDGWGRPIYFLRWAPAFSSPLQQWTGGTPPAGNDVFDHTNAFERAYSGMDTFPVFPLIYSAGPDGVYDVKPELNSGSALQFRDYNNNPFETNPNIVGVIGKRDFDNDGDGSIDNITNHDIEAR